MEKVPSSSRRQVDFLVGQVFFKAYLTRPVGTFKAQAPSHPPTKSLTRTSKKWLQASKMCDPLVQRTSWNPSFNLCIDNSLVFLFFHDCQDVKGLSPLEAGCIRTKVMEDGEFVNFICENFSFTCNSATIGTCTIEICQGTFP